jgi:hypothetical protein
LKRKLVLLNLALVALIALAAWQARQTWAEAERRERAVLRASHQPLPPPPFAPLPAVEPLAAAAYEEVAQKMLFTPDRNPTVTVEPVKPVPMPPLPVSYGVLNFGDGPIAILGEKAGAPHRGYQPGQTIGAFKLLSATSDQLVVEWKGQKIARKVEELRVREAGGGDSSASEGSSRPASVSPSQQSVVQVAPERPLGPGEAVGNVRTCQPGDNTPPGAVVQGFRKVVSTTPFGKVCRWEPVQ